MKSTLSSHAVSESWMDVIQHLTLHFRVPKRTTVTMVVQFDLGVNTSSPTGSMHESRKIHACFIFTTNPSITWVVKMCPMYWRDPHQKFTITATYPSLIVDSGVVSEVDIPCS